MNGKKAKQLRMTSRLVGVDLGLTGENQYVCLDNSDMLLPGMMTVRGTLRLKPSCLRYFYQKLKQQRKLHVV